MKAMFKKSRMTGVLRRLFAIVFLLVALSVEADQHCCVRLSDGGRALAKIVVAGNANKAARFGAADLKWHLDRITGGSFEIVKDSDLADENVALLPTLICVGPSRFVEKDIAVLTEQEFIVQSENGRIILAGFDKVDAGGFVYENDGTNVTLKGQPGFYDAQGSMYAVYDFLEKECGVIWADLSDSGTHLPHMPDLSVRIKNRKSKPFVAYRGGTIDRPNFGRGYLLWKSGTHEWEEARRLMYGNPKSIVAFEDLFRLRHRIGGRQAPANHAFYHYYDKYWNEESKDFIRKWPEIFAKGYVGQPPQMCYSSKEFIDLVIRDVRAYFNQNPRKGKFVWGRDNYALEPMDSSFYCKCKDCQSQMEPERAGDKASDSTYWFRFVKTVADEIAKTHPTKQISTLAYHSHEGLPHGVCLPKNVVVYFCLSANREPYRTGYEQQLTRMLEWRKAYPEQPIAMWLYNTFPLEHTNRGGFNCFPGFFAHVAAGQYQFFHEYDFSAGIFHCGMNGDVDSYMQFEWMIDPTRDPDVMLDEFFRTYGRAGEPLKEYYRLVERRYCDLSRYPKGGDKQTSVLAWGGDEMPGMMEKLGELMAEAERLAESTHEKRRVAIWKQGVWKYMREGYDTFVERQRVPKPEWVARRVPSAEGDMSKIAWSDIPSVKFKLYNAGSDRPSQFSGEARLAHDGDWFYLELLQVLDTSKLINAPGIFPNDTWEIFIARQESMPYRHYASSPDGRIVAMSNGEVNWRRYVPATESGPPAFGAKAESDMSVPGVWKQRFAFPLNGFTDAQLVPGDVFYMNCVRVTDMHLTEKKCSNILGVTPCTTVHTTDRMGKVTLEK